MKMKSPKRKSFHRFLMLGHAHILPAKMMMVPFLSVLLLLLLPLLLLLLSPTLPPIRFVDVGCVDPEVIVLDAEGCDGRGSLNLAVRDAVSQLLLASLCSLRERASGSGRK